MAVGDFRGDGEVRGDFRVVGEGVFTFFFGVCFCGIVYSMSLYIVGCIKIII